MKNVLRVDEEAFGRLDGPLKNFRAKVNGADGSEWERAFERFLRQEPSWPCPHCYPFRETGELVIAIPALPRPTFVEARKQWSWLGSIERDTSLTSAITLRLGTIMRLQETMALNASEYERRLEPKLAVLLGHQQSIWLAEHQNEFPALMTLPQKVYIDFPGLVVVSEDGRRRCPSLRRRNGQRWDVELAGISNRFYPYGRIAVAGK